jgi:hypothetical protein
VDTDELFRRDSYNGQVDTVDDQGALQHRRIRRRDTAASRRG